MNHTPTIYADYQATTPLDPRVLERMAPFWRESFGNPHSSDHAVGWQAHRAVEDAAASVAALIGADTDEIVFTSGATEANNLALLGFALRAPPGANRILVSAIEHKCVLAASRAIAHQKGFKIETIPVDQEGMIDLSALEAALGDDVLMASFMAINNEVGSIQDVPSISELLSSRNIPFHCDAAQAPCGMEMLHIANHADMVSLSAHKMYGPQGIGALFVRRHLQDKLQPILYGGDQQRGLRPGTIPLPLCTGFGAAAELLQSPAARAELRRLAQQRDHFIRLLQDGGAQITLNGPSSDKRHPGNANVCFHGYDAASLLLCLQPRISASTGAACTSGIPEPSHVLRAMNRSREEASSSIRFSFGRFTSDQEITHATTMILTALNELISED